MNSTLSIADIQFKHPFTCMVSGPSGSGKTVWVRRFLSHHNKLISSDIVNLKVLWCYGQWQDLYTHKVPGPVEITYLEGLPSEREIQESQCSLIVIDDLMNELGNNIALANLFTKGSHHMNLSVVFIVQNLFHQGKQMRTVSLNCHYLTIFKNPRDKMQISTLARQLFPENFKYLLESYTDATSKPYSYISIDLKPNTDDRLRLRTRLTPEENEHNIVAPILYLPKKDV